MIQLFLKNLKNQQNPKILIPLKYDDSALLQISIGERPFDEIRESVGRKLTARLTEFHGDGVICLCGTDQCGKRDRHHTFGAPHGL